jgi:Spy/CpxP family protein refolding chaperone
MKKYGIIIAAVFLIPLLMGFTCCHEKMHHAFPFFKGMDKEVKKLNLTQVQQEKYNDIRVRVKKDMKDRFEQMHSEVENTLKSDNPDINALSVKIKQEISERPDMRIVFIDYFMEFYNVLNPDQQKTLLSDISKKLKDRPGLHASKSKHPDQQSQ